MSITKKPSRFTTTSNEYKLNRWISTLFAFVIGLAFNFCYVSQTAATTLVNDGVVSGEIADQETKITYTFTAQAGDSIHLHVVDSFNSKLKPGFVIYDPNGKSLASASGEIVAAVNNIRILENGVHTVVVANYFNILDEKEGPFPFVAYFTHIPSANEGGTLINDSSVSGTINLGDIDSYTFTGNAGETIYMRVVDINNTAFIPHFDLYDPNGKRLAYKSSDKVAQLSNFKLLETGKYTVVITDGYYNLRVGDYKIYFVRFPGANEGGMLSSGDTISGAIDLGELDSYTFNAQVGDNIEIKVTDISNSVFKPFISVFDPTGNQIITASNEAVATISIKPKINGVYSIVVGDNTGNLVECCYNTGNYTLTLNCTNANGASSCNGSGTVNPRKKPVDSCETSLGNPIDFSLGFKYQIETDYANGLLAFKRYYRSDADWYTNSVGIRWRHNYDRTIEVSGNRAHVTNEKGSVYIFESDAGGNWTPIATDHDVTATLISTSTGYLYTTAEDTREKYDTSGKLIRVEARGGRSLDFTYDVTNRLIQVNDESGRSIDFSYNGSDSTILGITTPDGVFSYSYGLFGNLITVTKPDALTRTYHYENTSLANALTGITDEKGTRFATYGYDTQGRGILSEHAGGVENYSIAYNTDGSVTTTNPLGKQTTYHFETILGVRKVVSVEGHASTYCAAANQAYTYDARGFVQSKTDWNGNQTRYVYDQRGLVTSMTEAAGSSAERTINYTYDTVYRLPTVINESGKVTSFSYDAQGRVMDMTITDSGTGQSRITAYTYHPNSTDTQGHTILGRLASINGPRTDVNDVTLFAYDAGFNLISITNALNHKTDILIRDAAGRPTLIKDSNGVNTAMIYDAMGRLTKMTRGTAATSYVYDQRGLLTKVTFPNGAFLNYVYDNARRLTQVSNSNSKIVYTLDKAGNRIAEFYRDNTNAIHYQKNQQFDELSRLMQSASVNQSMQYSYDVNGNLTKITDGNFNNTLLTYDALDRLVRSTDALNGLTTSTLNDLDQATSITDPRDNATQYVYNAFGNLIQEISPDRGTTTYTVDLAGNTLKRTDARGIATNYKYDALNRLTNITYPSDASLNTTFAYDKATGCGISKGRLCSITNGTNITSYIYNALGYVTKVTDKRGSLNFITAYTYDAAGVLTKITLPSGRVITNTLNANKEINKVSATVAGVNVALASGITYLPFGNIKALTYGNGLTLANTYNTAYQLTSRQIGSLMNDSYSYDAAGNIIVKSAASYDYDSLYRLLHENGSAGLYDYSYDAIGNRLTSSQNGTNSTYNYPVENSKLNKINTKTISYDAAGNIISDAERSYTIDAAGHIRTISVSGAVTGTYSYDSNNLRIRKTIGANTMHYIYGLNGLLQGEYDGAGQLIREYVYLNDEPLAQVNADQTVAYLHTDHLGTPRIASNNSATKVWEWNSDAFGNGTPTGALTVNLRFPGQYYDQESKLHYNWHRYYDPKTGRYITSDPIGLGGGLNLYAYAMGNTIVFSDNKGLQVSELKMEQFQSIGTALITLQEAFINKSNKKRFDQAIASSSYEIVPVNLTKQEIVLLFPRPPRGCTVNNPYDSPYLSTEVKQYNQPKWLIFVSQNSYDLSKVEDQYFFNISVILNPKVNHIESMDPNKVKFYIKQFEDFDLKNFSNYD